MPNAMDPIPDEPPKKPIGDLRIRTASAVVMLAVAGSAVWFGGWVWFTFAIIIGLGVYYEWCRLAFALTDDASKRTLWILGGIAYVGLSTYILARPSGGPPFPPAIIPIASVVGTDVGAYFFGRSIGGPKIAPKISPSKTWSGLIGGMIGSTLALGLVYASPLMWYCDAIAGGRNTCDLQDFSFNFDLPLSKLIVQGAFFACIAQAGDFFQSWMKRRAGVKDSGGLIPGHGGLFDRVDGLIAVAFTTALFLAGREFL